MPPKLKSIAQIKEEILQQKKSKRLQEIQRDLPDFTSAYFEETATYEPVPALLYYKTYVRTVQRDDEEYYEQQEYRMQRFYDRMQKVDDQLYCKQENAKFRQFLKAEIYEDKMKIYRQMKAELDLEKQITLMEEYMRQKKYELLIYLEEQKRLQKVAEQALMAEYSRKQLIQRYKQQYEIQQERQRAMIALKQLKKTSQAELADIEHYNNVERLRMLAAMKEGVFQEERQMQRESVKLSRSANEKLIQQRIEKVVESAAKVEAKQRQALQRKTELEYSQRKPDEKTLERIQRAAELVEQRRNRALAIQQERGRVYALRELLGE